MTSTYFMPKQQQDAIRKLAVGEHEITMRSSGSVEVYCTGTIGGIRWEREYVVTQDGTVHVVRSKP